MAGFDFDEPELFDFSTIDWPKDGRRLFNEAAGLLTIAVSLALERARNHGEDAKFFSTAVRLQESNRDKDTVNGLLYRRLKATSPKHRAHYSAQDRVLIMTLAAKKFWTAKSISDTFLVDAATARDWLKIWRTDSDSTLFVGKRAWNSYDDALNDLVHRIRSIFPEADIGARTIANYILKAAVAISRSSVQRYLKQPPPSADDDFKKLKSTSQSNPKPEPEPETPAPVEAFHVLKPEHVNHVWHVDFSKIKFLWSTFWVVAILDGFSRKLLSLKISVTTPTTASTLEVLKASIAQFGAPRFIITDHGCQFRETFAKLVRGLKLGINVLRGPVRHPQFNGKVERFFRTMKLWQRLAALQWLLGVQFIQRKLDFFRDWYNQDRVHQGVHGLTPNEAWAGTKRPEPVRYFARDKLNPIFTVRRRDFQDDPYLPIFDISVSADQKTA
jgi:transposase InsO family protein